MYKGVINTLILYQTHLDTTNTRKNTQKIDKNF